MKKKTYEKPSMKVYVLNQQPQILVGSCNTPAPTAPIWGGEGN